jgi:hypothetical protein
MRTPFIRFGTLAVAAALGAGCSSGQSNSQPPFTTANLNQNKAQLAVGIATFADGSKGLNAVATFRQPDGLSATLANTPTITGPPGFVVPKVAAAGIDGGTNHISGTVPPPPLSSPTPSTFGTNGGAFNFGFAPINSDATGALYNSVYNTAFYSNADLLAESSIGNPIDFRGGPPAYPNVLDGDYPSGFLGFTQGFTTFAVKPVPGTYQLSIYVAAADTNSVTIAGTPGVLRSTAGLGPIAKPAFKEDGGGGGTATCTVPGAATETLVDLSDVSASQFYTVVVHHGGAIAATFAPNLGAYSAGTYGPTIASGDEYSLTCIAVDYPVFESGPPNNSQQLPAITGAGGQADVSFSPNLDGTY